MALRVHAICLALNEEVFITDQLKTLYPFCSGISVMTQYDRDWYSNPVSPDSTVTRVLSHDDPEGKISLVVRRWRDETAARNHELLAWTCRPDRPIQSHGSPIEDIRRFHDVPDYFMIVDADDFYDPDTFGNVLDYLAAKRPKAMRTWGYYYVKNWNWRFVPSIVSSCSFSFVRPGALFGLQRGVVSWSEPRIKKVCQALRLPDLSKSLLGYVDCPREVGFFHHGAWIGPESRIWAKVAKASNMFSNSQWFVDRVYSTPREFVPTESLPRNIREGTWPADYFEPEAADIRAAN